VVRSAGVSRATSLAASPVVGSNVAQRYWSAPRATLDVVRALLAFGASPMYAAPATGRTALHVAAERGVEARALEALVAAGASTNAEDADGRTPLQVAERGGHAAAARALRRLHATASPACRGCGAGLAARCAKRRRRRGGDDDDAAGDDSDVGPLLERGRERCGNQPPVQTGLTHLETRRARSK